MISYPESDKENNKQNISWNDDTTLSFKRDRIRASLDAREADALKDISVKKERLSPVLKETAFGSSQKRAIEISSDGPAPLSDDTPLVFEGNGTYIIPSGDPRDPSGTYRDDPSDRPRIPSGHRSAPSDRSRVPSRVSSGSRRRVPSDRPRVPSGSARVSYGKTRCHTRLMAASSNTSTLPTASTSVVPLDGSPIEIPDSKEERVHKRNKTDSNE